MLSKCFFLNHFDKLSSSFDIQKKYIEIDSIIERFDFFLSNFLYEPVKHENKKLKFI